MIKHIFGIRQVRVRDFGNRANIEVDKNDIVLLHDKKRMTMLEKYMNGLGFDKILIDPNGYRPGKLNVITD